VLTNTDFDLGLRIRFPNAMLFAMRVLLYGMEGWTLEVRRIPPSSVLRIPWTARRTNNEILRIINKDSELRGREGSAGKRCHGSATLRSGQN